MSLWARFVVLFLCILYGNCVPDTWPLEPLGLCLVCPFCNPFMVGECSQTIKGKFNVLIILISTLGCDILQRRALGFFSDHTSLAPQSSQCSLCKRHCDGVPPDHKFVSRRTKVPSAIWGMADLHKAWCLKASGRSRTGWRGSLHCLCIQRSSWTIRSRSSWSTQTILPSPSQAPQMDGSHAKTAMSPSSLWTC